MKNSRSYAKIHFHIALTFGIFPFIGMVISLPLLILNLVEKNNDTDHKKWTRRLTGIVSLDILVVIIMFVMIFLHFDTIMDPSRQSLQSRSPSLMKNRAAIGVELENNDEIIGAPIKNVLMGSPADKAGLKSGDYIIRIGKQKVTNSQEFASAIATYKPGKSLSILHYRGERKNWKRIVAISQHDLMKLRLEANADSFDWKKIDRSFILTWLCFFLILTMIFLIAKKRKSKSGAAVIISTFFIVASTIALSYLVVWILVQNYFFSPISLLLIKACAFSSLLLIISSFVRLWLNKKYDDLNPVNNEGHFFQSIGLSLLYNYGILFRILIIVGVINFLSFNDQPSSPLNMLLYFENNIEIIAIVATITFIGPIAEEIAFRGILFNGLLTMFKPIGACILSSIIFAVLHAPSHGFAILGILWIGIILAWLYHKTGRLAASIILHIIINSVSVAIFYAYFT